MTVPGWVLLGTSTAVVVWLALALVGVVRELAALRSRVDELEAATPVRVGEGLGVGRRAPGWAITTPDGAEVRSEALAGERHLLVFADADCRACDELVPDVVAAATERAVPATTVIGRGDPTMLPPSWRTPTSGIDRADVVSEAFHVDVTPYVFVVDEGGVIVAQGGATDLRDVERMVAAADAITILGEADG
jgi:hypothetical protein